MTRALRTAVAAGLALIAVLVGDSPATAGGSTLTPVEDRYEAGEVATLVGYTGGPQLEASGAPGPYRAFLEDAVHARKIEVGQLQLTDTGRRGWEALRVVARFVVPADLPPGQYILTYCADPCDGFRPLGDLISGFLSVGVDPLAPWSHTWPLDEPEIANLADDAILAGPGYQTTVAQVRAGHLPQPPGPADASPPAPRLAPSTPAPDRPAIEPVHNESAPASPAPGTTPAPDPGPSALPALPVLLSAGLAVLLAVRVTCRTRRRPHDPVPAPTQRQGNLENPTPHPGPSSSAPRTDPVAASRG